MVFGRYFSTHSSFIDICFLVGPAHLSLCRASCGLWNVGNVCYRTWDIQSFWSLHRVSDPIHPFCPCYNYSRNNDKCLVFSCQKYYPNLKQIDLGSQRMAADCYLCHSYYFFDHTKDFGCNEEQAR